jgi:hypothetical protein
MSYSKFERGKYIRLKMIHLLLLDLLPAEQFGITWDLIDEIETNGTTHCQELAQNEYYKKAVAEWVKAKQAQRQRFTESKSM